jgi:hypothetical protein
MIRLVPQRRSLSVLIAVTVVMTVAGVLLWGCGGDGTSSPQTSQGSPQSTSAPTSTTMQGTESTGSTEPAGSATSVASATTSTTAAGQTTTSGPGTTSTSASTSSTSASSTSTSGTTGGGAKIFGKVLDTDGAPVGGATIRVVYNAADKHYRASGDNMIGTAKTDAQGNFEIPVGSLALGTIVDVTTVAEGHTSVLVYGKYDEKQEQVDFGNFGKAGGDRRMPVGDQMPPFPFEGLLPD